ncbi:MULTISPECIES: c-type cytochrome [unclassified Bradyrhizobium]|uniref:c-type cytochrome n=1 Tax=unclassified Bradyrhizobium TaxID=2631580 RepID=UPI0024797456|nr:MULTISPECIES: c-type cytochrome [unclassified Bradyrhizobium]WGR68707.1 c-type cytochrome [Bradyrhizobium sp. ISRA426]WGR80762.1 c-type cytochrome [Bradyrhizobium sp. ISRA430]WGR83947.1 c-type cytochrome [Bradyrhizobium sp. ISRA432]
MGLASRARVAVAVVAALAAFAAHAEMAGHGGAVRALAVSPDGESLLSGSFDTAAVRWSLKTEAANEVLRYHVDAVNAVAFLKDGRMITAGADARIAVWTAGRQQPDQILEGHTGPVAALSVSPDGSELASASWDHSVRLWSLADGSSRAFEGHALNVNGVAFAPDGKSLVSVGYDLALRIWRLPDGQSETVALPAPPNAVAVAPDGEIVVASADGKLRMLTADGKPSGEAAAGSAPIIALALSDDGALIAAAGIGGTVAIVERKSRSVLRTLVGPESPVWSVVFLHDAATLVTGGADGKIRRWNVQSGEPVGSNLFGTPADPLATYAGDRGAEVFRACVACHTLSAKEAQRAGPTLAGLFGRRIASLPGYRFSEALKKMEIVWTPETVAKLFEVGPTAYTPGTKMPEQRIGSAEDRRALTDFLSRATSQ